jgi:hypothetical protein
MAFAGSCKVFDCEGSIDRGTSSTINVKVIPMSDDSFGAIK